ncbi:MULTISPECIES: DUF2726 domain-containing protein [Enterobacteriaceae]|uniref:Uncharacterized protein n=2 Tax=Enterobacter cloacae TaxID=550 RepID=A0A0H3CV43_ENTCC|nr:MULTISPECIES: DUF2726 domain-containing protein [Enterobacteriaceae]EAO4330392.1 DUF2726 domain-containing protein [Salmonella enterica]ECD5592884.1 DUF2726 domain-containing protein [Salmonella enterica subsp. enterica serovar Typhimurium]ECG6671103.1 DUF2726 domain-containing protein [Salmonella enterica subsp. enterica serovar Weltevreden]ECW5176850.1 DUF2726 domain-containing protein [Salmonella enterica subsp. enterica serovar Enteritidis]EDF3626265.1 DUF2726 domain-containing protein 
MTDEQINYVGFAILAALFWYVQIYRPRKKMRNPGELSVKAVMNPEEQQMYNAINFVFPSPYILKSNVSLDDLLFSPDMDKKAHFHKSMRQHQVAWLVLDEKRTPLLAVDFLAAGEDLKMNYLSQAGVGCCIFTPGTSAEQMIQHLQEAADSLNEMQNGQYAESEQPATA